MAGSVSLLLGDGRKSQKSAEFKTCVVFCIGADVGERGGVMW